MEALPTLTPPADWHPFAARVAAAAAWWLAKDGSQAAPVFDAGVDLRIGDAAVECKDYEKGPVTLETMEAFQAKLEKAGAKRGVFVSKSGFQRAAQGAAKKYGIGLLILARVDKKNLPNDLTQRQKAQYRATSGDIWRLKHENEFWDFAV